VTDGRTCTTINIIIIHHSMDDDDIDGGADESENDEVTCAK